ncbi:8-amino-7-oxononanoate synthase [Jatrophihabitans sp.]|uniref:8-amino-7-oxononanoate synthase n=1 Tax=Jatrophihabitans sp. TaxID=1932789 RepID=UPI0030C70D7C|nr:8-amino-7-oxononanoate synthase [Jatrophihabitans sp.]
MSSSLDRVRAVVTAREEAGLRRYLRPRASGDDVLDLAGNDYLGLSRDPRVIAAAAAAGAEWGAGSTGSRLVTGTTALHLSFEESLAAFLGAEAALVFSSGYLANLGVLTALAGPEVTIVSDAGNHASVIDGCRLSGATIAVYPHGDLAKAEAALATVDTAHALIVTDGVFSVDGDVADIAGLHALARRFGALLVVDEAHALGVVGPGGVGSVAAAGLAGEADVVRTVTLSKSLGAQGGAVLGARAVIDLLISTARPFIFDTGLAPASVGAAAAALGILAASPDRAAAVLARADALASIVRGLGVETVVPAAAVVPAVLGDPLRAVAAAAACLELGLRVGCFRPPSVPAGRSCLRLTARADLTPDDLDRAATVLARVLG